MPTTKPQRTRRNRHWKTLVSGLATLGLALCLATLSLPYSVTAANTPTNAATNSPTNSAGAKDVTAAPTPVLSIPIPQVSLSRVTTAKGDITRDITIPWIAEYLIGAYKFATGAAVILAVVMITIGGFEYVVAGSAKGSSSGKKRITNAVTGLLVVLMTYLILNTINPDLTNLKPIKATAVRRISFVSNESNPADLSGGPDGAPSGGTIATGVAASASNMPYINQGNYKNVPYMDHGRCRTSNKGVPFTVQSSGCGIASAAMVMAPLTGKSGAALVPELAKLAGDSGFRSCDANCTDCNGTVPSFFTSPSGVGTYGLKGDTLNGKNAIVAALQQGKPVIVLAGKGIFTSQGHYVVFAGINADGSIKVMDPGKGPWSKYDCDRKSACPNLNPPIAHDKVPQDVAFAAVKGGWYIHK